MRLESVTCVLTGASGAIGAALARALAGAGARLVLNGRDADKLGALAMSLPSERIAAICPGDLNQAATQEDLVAAAHNAGAAALINVAGANSFGWLDHQHPDALRTLIETNLIAPVTLTRRMLPLLTQSPEAMVVNVGSTFGAIGYPGYAAYCASKFGLRGFSEALARELADGPVHVLYVAPRAVDTPMNSRAATALNEKLGNQADSPEHVASTIVTAMTRQARRTGIGWPERLFARLNQVVPGVMDRALAGQLSTIKEFAKRD